MRAVHINPQQKSHAVGLARQACARVFRDGGAPSDALEAFGLAAHGPVSDWSRAVDLIADALCSRTPTHRAAA
ncbi:MAG: hypothetical protein KDJ36_00580 [Hyphomicrobiaceae bacterium]|nr:hypothetical protein [Hyphomicrobiaceae bacterium]